MFIFFHPKDVIAGLDPAIHPAASAWTPGSNPGMTPWGKYRHG